MSNEKLSEIVSNLSYDELQEVVKLANASIKKLEKNRKKEGLAKIQSLMAEYDLCTDDLSGKATKKVAAKYRNPENEAEEWTGRGRKPVWVLEALDNGKTLEDLEI